MVYAGSTSWVRNACVRNARVRLLQPVQRATTSGLCDDLIGRIGMIAMLHDLQTIFARRRTHVKQLQYMNLNHQSAYIRTDRHLHVLDF